MIVSRVLRVSLVICACALLSHTASAKIYKWKDANGKVHFGERPPQNLKADELKAPAKDSVKASSLAKVGEPKIVIYTTSWCAYCKKAKAFFASNNISYKEYDIEKSRVAKREYDRIGGRGVPVILVGEQRMNGFSEKGFERVYELAKES